MVEIIVKMFPFKLLFVVDFLNTIIVINHNLIEARQFNYEIEIITWMQSVFILAGKQIHKPLGFDTVKGVQLGAERNQGIKTGSFNFI